MPNVMNQNQIEGSYIIECSSMVFLSGEKFQFKLLNGFLASRHLG